MTDRTSPELDEREPLDALEVILDDEGFRKAWRQFLRAVCLEFRNDCPEFLDSWWKSADAYDSGEISAAELTRTRVDALGSRQACGSEVDSTAHHRFDVLVARLWPDLEDPEWSVGAYQFQDDCDLAGMNSDQWLVLLDQYCGEYVIAGRAKLQELKDPSLLGRLKRALDP